MLVSLEDCVYISFASAWTVEWIIFMLRIQEFIRYRFMPGEYQHSSPQK
jgi:hypothetical protein